MFGSFEHDLSVNTDPYEFRPSHEGVSEVSERAREQSVAKQSAAERVSAVSGASERM